MKILHLNEHLSLKGGVETYLFSAIPLLEERGVQSQVVYSQGDPSFFSDAHHLPLLGKIGFTNNGAAGKQLEKILRAEKPDIIHVHNVQNTGILDKSLEFGRVIATTHDYRWICPANSFFYKNTQEICTKTCGLGCFTTTLSKHCLSPRPNYALNFYHRAKWTINHAEKFSHIITPSERAKQRYSDAGFPENAITVLPYFCSIEPSSEPRRIPERPTITYLGRIAPNKGHEYFVKALGLLPENVRGLIVGGVSSQAEQELKKLARENNCEERLDLHGWASREEVLHLMDETSVFIFPSLWPETLGIVGIEALSRGVPVVASDVGGVNEWCIDGKTGFTVNPKDYKSIAESVQYLLQDEERLRRFGQNGIDLINKKFLPESHIDELVSIYKNVLS